MKCEKIKTVGKALAIAGVAGVVLGAGAVAYALSNPKTVTVEKEIPVEVIKQIEVVKEIEVPVNVTVEKIVEVDNGKLDLVLDEIFDNDGKVQYLTEDLDEDEVSEIVDRIVFANEAKALAVDYVKKELADELDNVVFEDVEFDEDDVEKIRLDDDSDEIELDNIDYEDKDVDVTVTGKFRHDDEWFEFEAKVEIEDNEVEDFEVEVVSKLE